VSAPEPSTAEATRGPGCTGGRAAPGVLLGLGSPAVVLGLGRLLPQGSSLVLAGRLIEAFGARLRDQVDLDTLTGELPAVVDQTMAPTQAWLWQRPPPGTAGR
jgi:hypothetical protein